MSSSNQVSIVYGPETAYGKKDLPISGVALKTAFFTSEGLSGTPITKESELIRTDRMSGGQNVVGLDTGGPVDFELAVDDFFDDWFEAAMMTTWVAKASSAETVTLTPDGGDDQKATVTIGGDYSSIGDGVAVNDVIQLLPASGAPVVVSVITVDSTTQITAATEKGQAAISAVAMTVAIPAHLDIGTTKKSFIVGKAYRDVLGAGGGGTDQKSQTYLGELVAGFSLDARHGNAVEGSFSTLGNGYELESPSYEQQVIAGGGSVAAVGTNNTLNASVDVPVIATGDDDAGAVATTFCIEGFQIELNNGLTPENCLGSAPPRDYALGQASLTVTTDIHLSTTSYEAFMASKLSQEPKSMLLSMINSSGGYAFQLSAVQLSFPDGASPGRNQAVKLQAGGVGKVGPLGVSALRIWKLEGDQ